MFIRYAYVIFGWLEYIRSWGTTLAQKVRQHLLGPKPHFLTAAILLVGTWITSAMAVPFIRTAAQTWQGDSVFAVCAVLVIAIGMLGVFLRIQVSPGSVGLFMAGLWMCVVIILLAMSPDPAMDPSIDADFKALWAISLILLLFMSVFFLVEYGTFSRSEALIKSSRFPHANLGLVWMLTIPAMVAALHLTTVFGVCLTPATMARIPWSCRGILSYLPAMSAVCMIGTVYLLHKTGQHPPRLRSTVWSIAALVGAVMVETVQWPLDAKASTCMTIPLALVWTWQVGFLILKCLRPMEHPPRPVEQRPQPTTVLRTHRPAVPGDTVQALYDLHDFTIDDMEEGLQDIEAIEAGIRMEEDVQNVEADIDLRIRGRRMRMGMRIDERLDRTHPEPRNPAIVVLQLALQPERLGETLPGAVAGLDAEARASADVYADVMRTHRVPSRADLAKSILDVQQHPRVVSVWSQDDHVVVLTDTLRMDDPQTGRIYDLGRYLIEIPATASDISVQPTLRAIHPYVRSRLHGLGPIRATLVEMHTAGDLCGLVETILAYLETPDPAYPDLSAMLAQSGDVRKYREVYSRGS